MPNYTPADALVWLESLQQQMAHLDEYKRRVEPQLASEFNLLRYARTDELGLSQILADMVDPCGPHGQGERFLICFLKLFWPEYAVPGQKVSVRTEVLTDRIVASQRRVDIEIDLGTGVLAIENKPWASDQPAQVSDYLAHLKALGRPFKLLYLAGQEGRLPSAQSIEETDLQAHLDSKTLVVTQYTKLQEWVRDCLRYCENERVAMFLRDLERIIATRFSGYQQGFESQLIVDTAISSHQGVSAAVQLARSATDVRLLLLRKLEAQIYEKYVHVSSEMGLNGWHLSIPKPLNAQYATIELALGSLSALKLALAFEKPNCGDCFFGIGRRCAEDNAGLGGLEKFDAVFGYGERSAWWGWSRAFDQRYWWNDRRVWVAIASGEMAGRIAKLLYAMAQIADKEFRPAFERPTKGATVSATRANLPRANALAQQIIEREHPPLIDSVLAVEKADCSLRRVLAERVASGVRDLLRQQFEACTWIEADQDMTQIYAGFGFCADQDEGLEVHVSFESWGCRNAIYGIRRSTSGHLIDNADLRKRLFKKGLEPGKESVAWVWYRSLTPSNWFDSPSMAASCRDGNAVSQIAQQLASLLEIIKKPEP